MSNSISQGTYVTQVPSPLQRPGGEVLNALAQEKYFAAGRISRVERVTFIFRRKS